MDLARWLPAVGWLRTYDRGALASDLLAAVIVTIMLIPQSLAYAMLAGLPPYVGLYASILPLVGYALFGSSRALAVGPVAVVSLMTAAAVSKIATPGSPEYLAAAIALAALSGLCLLALGMARLGFLANLLSHPVISGFITASGILIAASQLKHILGVPAGGHTLLEIGRALLGHLDQTNLTTLLIGALAVCFLFWVRSRLKPLLRRLGAPALLADILAKAGPIAAVLVTTLAVSWLGLAADGVSTVGDIPQGLPPLTLPPFDAPLWLDLLPAAILISLVGFVESVSVAQTLAARKRQRIDPNQELVGPGCGQYRRGVLGRLSGDRRLRPLGRELRCRRRDPDGGRVHGRRHRRHRGLPDASVLQPADRDPGRDHHRGGAGPGRSAGDQADLRLLEKRLRGHGRDHPGGARRRHRGRHRDRHRGLDRPVPLAHQPAAYGDRRPGARHRALPQRRCATR